MQRIESPLTHGSKAIVLRICGGCTESADKWGTVIVESNKHLKNKIVIDYHAMPVEVALWKYVSKDLDVDPLTQFGLL